MEDEQAEVNSERARDELLAEVDALRTALDGLPRGETIEKARYQAERLRVAIQTSHNEGTRFAAFTLGRITRELESGLPPEIPARMQQIRAALEASGHDLRK